jgi:hypothetical protein
MSRKAFGLVLVKREGVVRVRDEVRRGYEGIELQWGR